MAALQVFEGEELLHVGAVEHAPGRDRAAVGVLAAAVGRRGALLPRGPLLRLVDGVEEGLVGEENPSCPLSGRTTGEETAAPETMIRTAPGLEKPNFSNMMDERGSSLKDSFLISAATGSARAPATATTNRRRRRARAAMEEAVAAARSVGTAAGGG